MANRETATLAITGVRKSAQILGMAMQKQQLLEDSRCIEKRNAIQRIMQSENPLTGKQHSASSAEAVVETDDLYRKYRTVQSDAVLEVQTAWGEFYAARLEAELEVALIREAVAA